MNYSSFPVTELLLTIHCAMENVPGLHRGPPCDDTVAGHFIRNSCTPSRSWNPRPIVWRRLNASVKSFSWCSYQILEWVNIYRVRHTRPFPPSAEMQKSICAFANVGICVNVCKSFLFIMAIKLSLLFLTILTARSSREGGHEPILEKWRTMFRSIKICDTKKPPKKTLQWG